MEGRIGSARGEQAPDHAKPSIRFHRCRGLPSYACRAQTVSATRGASFSLLGVRGKRPFVMGASPEGEAPWRSVA